MRREPYPVGCSCCCCYCWFIRAVVLTRNLLVATGLGQQIKAENIQRKVKNRCLLDATTSSRTLCLSVRPDCWSATLNIYFSCRRSSKPICQHLGKHFNKPSYNPRCSRRQFRSLDQFYLSLSLSLFLSASLWSMLNATSAISVRISYSFIVLQPIKYQLTRN